MRRVSVKQRAPQTLEDLFHAEYSGMVRLAYTLVSNNAEAEEVVQDSPPGIAALDRLDHLGPDGMESRAVHPLGQLFFARESGEVPLERPVKIVVDVPGLTGPTRVVVDERKQPAGA